MLSASAMGIQIPIVGTMGTHSSGVAISEEGFDLARLVELKLSGLKLRELPEFHEGLTLAGALDRVKCEMLLEASPVDLDTGDPGLSNCRAALERGLHLVLANKAPLVLAQAELEKEERMRVEFVASIAEALVTCVGLQQGRDDIRWISVPGDLLK